MFLKEKRACTHSHVPIKILEKNVKYHKIKSKLFQTYQFRIQKSEILKKNAINILLMIGKRMALFLIPIL